MASVTQALTEPDEAPQDDDPASTDDSGLGLALFGLLTVAVLVVTAAVGFLALLTSWWVLGVVFGVHVLVTAIVGLTVFSVLGRRKAGLDDGNLVQLGVTTSPGGPVQSPARSSQSSPLAA